MNNQEYMNKTQILADIDEHIIENTAGAITATILNTALHNIVENVSKVNGNELFGTDNIPIGQQSITYNELVQLRDTAKLIPGMQYRITDYTCTTSAEDTQSANNAFDIIVVAIDESHLSEEAKAAHHAGDTYFSNSNLDAWKIWYCLDNNQDKFTWAVPKYITINSVQYTRYSKNDDLTAVHPYCWKSSGGSYRWTNTSTPEVSGIAYRANDQGALSEQIASISTGGKGVIYRMIDESNNDVPYDFKNIQFKRYKFTSNFNAVTGGIDKYLHRSSDSYLLWENLTFNTPKNTTSTLTKTSEYSYCYTFGSGQDYSVLAPNMCYNNIIQSYQDIDDGIFMLNNIVIKLEVGAFNLSANNYFNNNCYNMTLTNITYCYFDVSCRNIINDLNITYCIFRPGTNNVLIGENVSNVYLDKECYNILIGNNSNTITFGKLCSRCTIQDSCFTISIGIRSGNLLFNCYTYYINIGNSCANITFGSKSGSISIGEVCSDIYIGENNINIDIKNMSSYIYFGDTNSLISYMQNIIIKSAKYIKMTSSQTTSASNIIQNLIIDASCSGTSNNYTTLTITDVNQDYETYFKKNADTIVYV